MKPNIHPEYQECSVSCVCGNKFTTRSISPSIKVEICNACHPFFTGKQKIVDTAGRVERFMRKYGLQNQESQDQENKDQENKDQENN